MVDIGEVICCAEKLGLHVKNLLQANGVKTRCMVKVHMSMPVVISTLDHL